MKNKPYMPFDVVKSHSGSVGFISEVGECQGEYKYSVTWLVGEEYKSSWWKGSELEVYTNLFIEIAKGSCHPHGFNGRYVKDLFNKSAFQ